MIGQQFGRLHVKEYVGKNTHNRHVFFCVCECGNTKNVTKDNLLRKTTTSCGCYKRECIIARCQIPIVDLMTNQKYNSYFHYAQLKKVSFLLSKEEFGKLILSNCWYCGDVPSNCFKQGKRTCFYNGLDEQEIGLGYTTTNSVACCWHCNKMKGKENSVDFLQHCKRITNHDTRTT